MNISARWLALALCCALVPAHADYERDQASLEALRAQIKQIERELARERREKDGVRSELRMVEEQIAATAANLARLEQRAADKQARVEQLRRERAAERGRLDAHKTLLEEQLRQAYVGGQQEYLRLLLNQEDPARLDRLVAYYEYLSRARTSKIDTALGQLRRIAEIEQSLDQELAKLHAARAEALAERRRLTELRDQRTLYLARLDDDIEDKNTRLARLYDDAKSLERVLSRLRDALADVGETGFEQLPFAQQRGKLGWPLRGQLTARFGTRRGVGDLRWGGLLIEAAAGSQVKAVAHGHVVFADWLRGFGLLLIIEHGDGFMSLYGHNEAIYKEAGDWVAPGEVIASVGASGGRREPGLYFEIRAGGRPVDPLDWLAAR